MFSSASPPSDVAVGRAPAGNTQELPCYLNQGIGYDQGRRRAAGRQRFTLLADKKYLGSVGLNRALVGNASLSLKGAVVGNMGSLQFS
jgi:hypothetical protein